MKTLTLAQPLTVVALALNLAHAPAQAAVPEAAPQATAPATAVRALWDAEGEYELQDGRSLSLHVRGQRVSVAVGFQPEERWQLVSPELIVSPDGLQRLHLHRNATGRVERVSLELKRAP
ncbi:hypothetical protein [Inhella sp.]|uniref:hypothetical protein n=1 Tax=Inhella sp. TaxID=1921806 RepID=UPI0035B0D666